RLSQTEVGEHVGVTFQQIQKYEKGTNRVSAGRLAELAKLFGVPIAAFYSEAPLNAAKAANGPRISGSVADTNVNRLVKAFQALKDKNLKAAILRLAEEMTMRQ